ncbi:hypothetical protein BCR34DRAFT_391669 [Clohesyomyces aquaticus]|uniref:Secreted protein n=1 Tax=Clohesyomyces aquaticus TaxID=1231657 RepID=A0A1Y1ZFQ3_9PLEO|nr:hypothetical protein BCR34DRAFT_391669 [Clohesyomyces aquaticus]
MSFVSWSSFCFGILLLLTWSVSTTSPQPETFFRLPCTGSQIDHEPTSAATGGTRLPPAALWQHHNTAPPSVDGDHLRSGAIASDARSGGRDVAVQPNGASGSSTEPTGWGSV